MGKDPAIAADLDMEQQCHQATDVVQMMGRWEMDRVIIATPDIPNG